MTDHQQVHGLALPRLADLLDKYRKDCSFFASRRGAMLALGKSNVMEIPELTKVMRQGKNGLPIMAAIPFSHHGGAHVVLPRQVSIISGPHDAGLPKERARRCPQAARSSRRPVITAVPSAAVYCRNVEQALAQIQGQAFEKVVLARSLKVEAGIDLPALLHRLARSNPAGYTFALELAGVAGDRRSLVGASPELLLAKRGRQIISNPLAGSIARSDDPLEDARRAQRLRLSAKDRHEHALVVNAVAAALKPFCISMNVPPEPSLLSTQTMWHLSTEVKGELGPGAPTSLELALALHPTPAVCGYPSPAAYDFIRRVEGFDRGLFSGLVGWSNASGDGEWAVTIRCAEIGATASTIYAGAGIVAGSQPEMELAETSAKMRTMLRAMNLESVLEVE